MGLGLTLKNAGNTMPVRNSAHSMNTRRRPGAFLPQLLPIAVEIARFNDRETIHRVEAGEAEPPQRAWKRMEGEAEGTLFEQKPMKLYKDKT